MILAEHLVKEFHRPRRVEGRFAGLRSFLSPRRDTVRAVDDISLRIDDGEIVGYLGPNGAGKSTTIKMLTGVLVPTSGRVEVEGIVPWQDRRANARTIGAVFGQRTQLWTDLPLRESFELVSRLYGLDAGTYRRTLDGFVDLLDMGPFLDTPVRSLSLGQRMRGDLVAAMLYHPPVLYLDEPTVGLDAVAKARIREFITEQNRSEGTTVLLTTHDIADVEALAHRVVIIDNGRIVYERDLARRGSRGTTAAGGAPAPRRGLALLADGLLASAGHAARAQFAYRAATWTGIVGCVLQVVLVHLVWTAVYGQREAVAGVDRADAVTYAVLGVITSALFQPFVLDAMIGRLRTGAIAFDVMRPVPAPPMALARQVGGSVGQLPAVLTALVVGLASGAIAPPGSLLSGLAVVPSLLLGFSIALLMNFLVGLAGFWTLEVGGAFLIYRMLAQFSSGALIPLWFMPGWLSGTLTALPFSAQVFVPLSIYVETDPGWSVLGSLALQVLWVVVLVVVCALVWRRAVRRLVVFGG